MIDHSNLVYLQATLDDINSRLRFLEKREKERTEAEDEFCEEMEALVIKETESEGRTEET